MYHGPSGTAAPSPSAIAFTYGLRAATEAAALAAHAWLAAGDRTGAARAAAEAMRRELGLVGVSGTVVVGEGVDGSAQSVLPPGLVLEGRGAASAAFDIALDPVEGTSYLTPAGINNALAVVALAPAGALFRPGPAFYMEKFAGPPLVRGRIDPAAPVAEKLAILSDILDKPVADLCIYVQEKPRHRPLVDAIQRAGARVALYAAGDVAGALMAAIPGSGIDAMMGTGGTPEAIITACTIKALGGEFLGRINPQLNTERMAVGAAGLDTRRWMGLDDLVSGPVEGLHVCATGIADGLLLNGPAETPEGTCLQSLLVTGGVPGRQVVTSWRRP